MFHISFVFLKGCPFVFVLFTGSVFTGSVLLYFLSVLQQNNFANLRPPWDTAMILSALLCGNTAANIFAGPGSGSTQGFVFSTS